MSEKLQRTFDGHAADTVRPVRHEIIRGGLPLRSPATLLRSSLYSHNKCRSPHGKGSHWLAVQFLPKSYSAYYFDSYGMPPSLVPTIHAFVRRNCTVWDYNRRQLQGLSSNVCGKYCWLFALYASGGYGPRQIVELLDGGDRQIERAFPAEFGPPLRSGKRCGQCSRSRL